MSTACAKKTSEKRCINVFESGKEKSREREKRERESAYSKFQDRGGIAGEALLVVAVHDIDVVFLYFCCGARVVVHQELIEVLVLEQDLLVIVHVLLGLLENFDLFQQKVPDFLRGLVL